MSFNMVIGKQMTHGFAGNYGFTPNYNVRSLPVSEDSQPITYGDPVVLDGWHVKNIDASFTAENFLGIATSSVQTQLSLDSTEGQYAPLTSAGIMTWGEIQVIVQGEGEPELAKPVYVRVKNPTEDLKIGGFETTQSADVVKLDHVKWTTGKDANNVATVEMTQINLI